MYVICESGGLLTKNQPESRAVLKDYCNYRGKSGDSQASKREEG
jgi:hypothetical protein